MQIETHNKSNIKLYKYNVLVHESDFVHGSDWQLKFFKTFKISDNGYYDFGDDGQLWLTKKTVGVYQFININQLKEDNAIYGNVSLFKSECPYVGMPLGLFSWEWYSEKLENKIDTALCFAQVACGAIFKSNFNQYFEPISKVKYPLEDIVSSYGFEQGEALLFIAKKQEKYITDIQQTILDVLEQLSLEAGGFITYKNPRNWMQINKYHPQDKFKDSKIEFWGYDLSLYEDKNFRNFLDDD